MNSKLKFMFLSTMILILALSANLCAQGADWVAPTTDDKTKNPEDELKPAGVDKLLDTQTEPTISSFKFDERFNANGSFWHPTEYSHLAFTAGLGIISTDNTSGVTFDITAMFEYSLREMTNIPLSAFAQTGLGLTAISVDTPLGSSNETNFGLRSLLLGGKYRMLDGQQINNLFLSFLGSFGFGFGTDAGDGMFAGHKYLYPGDFSLILGGTANYLINDNMGFHSSFFFDLFFWSFSSESISDSGSEFGVIFTIEFFYQASIFGFHGGLDLWLCDREMNAQRYWLYVQGMHESGFYGQISIPLEGGGFVFVLLAGYEIPFGSNAKNK